MNRANFYHGKGPNFYAGRGALYGQGISHEKLRQMLRLYKTSNRLDPRESSLPLVHLAKLMHDGANGRGGFFPLAALIPLIGSALSGLGSAAVAAAPALAGGLATGAAGALGGLAVKKITGSGLNNAMQNEHVARVLLPRFLQYHDGQWYTGTGIGDLFKSLAGKFGNLVKNKHIAKIGSAARDAVLNKTVETLQELGNAKIAGPVTKKKTTMTTTKRPAPMKKNTKPAKQKRETVQEIVQTSMPQTTAPVMTTTPSQMRNPYEEMLLRGTGYYQ